MGTETLVPSAPRCTPGPGDDVWLLAPLTGSLIVEKHWRLRALIVMSPHFEKEGNKQTGQATFPCTQMKFGCSVLAAARQLETPALCQQHRARAPAAGAATAASMQPALGPDPMKGAAAPCLFLSLKAARLLNCHCELCS